jgi:membrane associated rhomboid family serine protease
VSSTTLPRVPSSDADWIETATRWAARLGMNPVRVRWRLRRLAADWERSKSSGDRPLEPKVSRAGYVFRHLGLAVPSVSVSLGLGVIITLCYARLMRASPELGFDMLFTMDSKVLWEHGRWWPRGFLQGEYWRPVTSLFLHIGLWHATFNLIALAVIGPAIEDMYGRGPTLFTFLLTGVLANFASGMMSPAGNAGASGALMGLIGLAAIRGHLQRTPRGREIRDSMLSWFVYTMIFGLVVRADNWAHGAGFLAGIVLGAVASPRWFRVKYGKLVAFLLGAVGTVITALAVLEVMWPGSLPVGSPLL